MKTLIIASTLALTFAASSASANPLTDLTQEVREEVKVTSLISKTIDLGEIRSHLRLSAIELYSRVVESQTAQNVDAEESETQGEEGETVDQAKAPE